jgi:uncharacterized damage-inducible protein DinB
MKQHLIDTFTYNNFANKKLISKISELPEKAECIKLVSHLINSQIKWMARIQQDKESVKLSWWEPLYELEDLETMWDKSYKMWVDFLQSKTEEEIAAVVRFTGMDGGYWEARLKDIALQLNYHSIHHRAQMQTIIRQQGLTPDFLDYIGTVYRKL